MEKSHNGRVPQWKGSTMERFHNGKVPYVCHNSPAETPQRQPTNKPLLTKIPSELLTNRKVMQFEGSALRRGGAKGEGWGGALCSYTGVVRPPLNIKKALAFNKTLFFWGRVEASEEQLVEEPPSRNPSDNSPNGTLRGILGGAGVPWEIFKTRKKPLTKTPLLPSYE